MRKTFLSIALLFLVLPVRVDLIQAQDNSITLTIIYDNYAYVDGMETDWGFAAIIETGNETILFDTGTRGDLYVVIEVRLPAKLTEKERTRFQELAGMRPEEK